MNPERTHWVVTSHGSIKRVHRADCRYAAGRPVYRFLGYCTEQEAAGIVIGANAWQWHEGCRFCALDFDEAMARTRWGLP